ncbi:MAG TPA: thioredoxin family protein [Pirellulales bacterium]|jgi:thioredoxin-related protein/tetratricopeptide (TPR) repeat protein|nr:thioredoxin family protein [Pirellulales bacterium]
MTATIPNQRPKSHATIRRASAAAWTGMLVLILAFPPPAAAAEPAPAKVHWLRGIDAALQLAAKTDRDVLINFTGRGWCYYCELLDRDVFAKSEFAAAADDFVLVEIDFPRLDEPPESDAAAMKKNREWQSKYLAPGVPTVVLVDAHGLPFAYTGYEPGITPASFLRQLKQFRAARGRRDRAMREAGRKAWTERATALDVALQSVAPHFGTLAERGGDPLLSWYGDTVQEICQLDSDDALGLQTRYKRRQEDLRQYVESEQVFAKLSKIESNAEALAYIAAVLPTVTDPNTAWRLERVRQIRLEQDRQNEAALANARRLLARPDLTRDQRDDLKDRVAFNLKNLSRYSEAVAQLDELIAANEDRPNRQLDPLSFKAWCLKYAADDGGDADTAIAAFQAWRARCKPGSDDWHVATRNLGIQFQQLGRFEQALAMRRELVACEAAPHFLLELTETYLSLGKTAEAEKTLSDAERAINAMPSERQEEQKTVAWLTGRATDLKLQMHRPNK